MSQARPPSTSIFRRLREMAEEIRSTANSSAPDEERVDTAPDERPTPADAEPDAAGWETDTLPPSGPTAALSGRSPAPRRRAPMGAAIFAAVLVAGAIAAFKFMT